MGTPVGMSHQQQHLSRDRALSPTLGPFCPCGGVQRAAYNSPQTRHLQSAGLGRCEALEVATGPDFLLDPAPSRRQHPEHPILPLEGVAAGEGVGHTTRVSHARNLPTCQFMRMKLQISRKSFSVITIRGKELSGRRDKGCVGGPSLSPSSRLHAGDVIND